MIPQKETLSDHEKEEEDDEDEKDPLDVLAEMGFSLTRSSEALLQSEGNLQGAIEFLTVVSTTGSVASAETSDAVAGGRKIRGKRSNKKKEKRQQQSLPPTNHHQQQGEGDSDNETEETTAFSTATATSSTTTTNTNTAAAATNSPKKFTNNNMSFKEQRKSELRFKKALRDQKKTCRVCGGNHPRKECPGISDDGRGHSRFSDKTTRAKENKERKHAQEQHAKDQQFLEQGKWTSRVPYRDGFANLISCYNTHCSSRGVDKHKDTTNQQELSLLNWILQWSKLEVSFGISSVSSLNPDQRKKELKTWTGSKLRATAQDIVGEEVIQRALKQPDPRSEMIHVILTHEYDDRHQEESESKRPLTQEWPGYGGCILPLGILDDNQNELLQQLTITLKDSATTSTQYSGCHFLLSISPSDITKWMVVESFGASNYGSQNSNASDAAAAAAYAAKPIDIEFLTKVTVEFQKTQAEMKKTAEKTLTAKNKKSRSAAQAEVARLRKVLESQRARILQHEEMLDSGGSPADSAHVDPRVSEKLDFAIDKYKDHPLVVGVCCGLDYDTPAARHSRYGPAIRQAQRDACTLVVQAAVKANLPIVVECNELEHSDDNDGPQSSSDAERSSKDPGSLHSDYNDGPQSSSDAERSSKDPASLDLIRILAQHAPHDAKILVRNGSLTTATKPGLSALLQTWPNFHIGLSAKVAYAKCPKELLDVVFDLPLSRMVLTSEAPSCLPPNLSGSVHRVDSCLPPHAACIADAVAKIKDSDIATREDVLNASTQNIMTLFAIQ